MCEDKIKKNRHSLRIITAPAIEPVTVAEVKLHARIDYSVQDSILSGWITSARQRAEEYQNRAYIMQELEIGFDCFPDVPIPIPRAPLVQVKFIKSYDYQNNESILYYDGDNAITGINDGIADADTNDNYLIDIGSEPGRVTLAYLVSWPDTTLRPIDALKIRYYAGYGTTATSVPGSVKEAIMLYCTWRDDNRAAEGEFPKQFYDLLSRRVYQ